MRFMLYVVQNEADGECWRWDGSTHNHKGYGGFWLAPRSRPAHQAAYLLFVGDIPPGAHVLHNCDHPWCVNPAHLRLGDNAANVADRVARNRSARTGAPRGTRNGNSAESRARRAALR